MADVLDAYDNGEIVDIEIAIIGGGPAGLSAANQLSMLGHKSIIVFERESEAGGTPRHCGHTGFGIAEFKYPMTGPQYAEKLVEVTSKQGVEIALSHTLVEIDDNILTFSSPDGMKRYRAKRILLATGARETPRSGRLVSGIRSPNIITTGALQRFVYLHEQRPFDRAVIIGSEAVSFSALMTCRHAGIKVAAMIEEESRINMFAPLKQTAEYLLKVPVYTGVDHIVIEGKNKEIAGVTIKTNDTEKFIECDGVIFSGLFTPEAEIMHTSFERFDIRNNSAYTTQNYQTDDPRFFVAGNALRGALTAFKCYFEGKDAAHKLHASLNDDKPLQTITIKADESIAWLSPNMIDINAPAKRLTTIRFKHATKGTLYVTLNDNEVMRQRIDAVPFLNVEVPWIDIDIKQNDKLKLIYKEGELY